MSEYWEHTFYKNADFKKVTLQLGHMPTLKGLLFAKWPSIFLMKAVSKLTQKYVSEIRVLSPPENSDKIGKRTCKHQEKPLYWLPPVSSLSTLKTF